MLFVAVLSNNKTAKKIIKPLSTQNLFLINVTYPQSFSIENQIHSAQICYIYLSKVIYKLQQNQTNKLKRDDGRAQN